VEQCDNLIEAKYLLKHLLDTTLEKSIEASKAASELKVHHIFYKSDK
jgi:hypothetical protein